VRKIKFFTKTNIVKDKLLPRKQTRTRKMKTAHHSANDGTDSALKDLLGLINQTEDLLSVSSMDVVQKQLISTSSVSRGTLCAEETFLPRGLYRV
jgi:hypothetical protein